MIVEVPAVDEMPRALRDVRLMGLQSEIVAAPVLVIDDVVTDTQFRQSRGPNKRVHPDREVSQLRKVAVTVAVAIVWVAVTILRKKVNARVAVSGDGGGIRVRDVVEGARKVVIAKRVPEAAAVFRGLLGDDVDDTRHRRCAEEGTAAAAHHLDAVNHLRRNLLKTVNAVQRGEYRLRVNEDLRIVTVQPVDAHLRETAVLAVVLHTESRHKV